MRFTVEHCGGDCDVATLEEVQEIERVLEKTREERDFLKKIEHVDEFDPDK